jgi:hypothetical protein
VITCEEAVETETNPVTTSLISLHPHELFGVHNWLPLAPAGVQTELSTLRV